MTIEELQEILFEKINKYETESKPTDNQWQGGYIDGWLHALEWFKEQLEELED